MIQTPFAETFLPPIHLGFAWAGPVCAYCPGAITHSGPPSTLRSFQFELPTT